MTGAAPVRVLVVEDEIITARSICADLETVGAVPVARVTSGEEAIAEALRLNPDLILMDIALARSMDGLEAAQRIVDMTRTAIVFMSGYSESYIRDRVDPRLSWSYIGKPVSLAALTAAVAAIT